MNPSNPPGAGRLPWQGPSSDRPQPPSPSPDPRLFRRVMGCFATGVAVVTTSADGEPHGLTVNSLTSVSLDPLILLVCLSTGSRTGAAIRRRGRFAVNLLAGDQEDLSRRFVSRDGPRFPPGSFTTDRWDLPLLAGALAHVVCEVHEIHPVGDHEVLYGRVSACVEGADAAPLVYWRGRYANLRDAA